MKKSSKYQVYIRQLSFTLLMLKEIAEFLLVLVNQYLLQQQTLSLTKV